MSSVALQRARYLWTEWIADESLESQATVQAMHSQILWNSGGWHDWDRNSVYTLRSVTLIFRMHWLVHKDHLLSSVHESHHILDPLRHEWVKEVCTHVDVSITTRQAPFNMTHTLTTAFLVPHPPVSKEHWWTLPCEYPSRTMLAEILLHSCI